MLLQVARPDPDGAGMKSRILFNLLQLITVMPCSPLVAGVLARLKENIQSKRGPSSDHIAISGSSSTKMKSYHNTATGFLSSVSVIFDAVLHPTTVEDTRETIHEHFRTAIRRSRQDIHILEWIVFRPLAAVAAAIANACARMHNGRLNAYVTYVLITLMGILLLSLSGRT